MLTLCYRSTLVNYQWGLAVSVYVAHWPLYITEILLKVELNTITPKPSENLHGLNVETECAKRIFD
jgi:hypothetical protein